MAGHFESVVRMKDGDLYLCKWGSETLRSR